MANKQNKYKTMADSIINAIGKDNIISITHCVTRLRATVKDRKAIDDDKVKDIPGVQGVFYTGGQYQVIVGTGVVNKVFDQITGVNKSSDDSEAAAGGDDDNTKKGWLGKLQKGIRILSDVFLPIVPILGCTGLFLGLKSVLLHPAFLKLFGMTPSMIPSSWMTIITILTSTAFDFLPAFICWSAFKKFGGTPIIGFLIGIMLVSPQLPNAYAVAAGTAKAINIGGIHIQGYQGSILTALLTGFLGAELEKWLRKRMPNSMDLIFTPFIVVLVMLGLAFFGFGPIVNVIEKGLVSVIKTFVYLPFGIGGFFIGMLYPLLVMTGLHQMSIIVETSLLAATKYNPVITVEAMYGFANAAVCLALAMKMHKKSEKAAGVSATITQLLGVSEPALFGVTLRAGLPAILTMILCSGLGGGVLSLLHIKANSYGLAVLLSPLMYVYNTHQLLTYVIVSVLTFALAFGITITFIAPKAIKEADKNAKVATSLLYTPVAGQVVGLSDVDDPVFSQKLMGQGFAVEPTDSKITSPVAGKVTMVAKTKHALGITTNDGLEILVHMGIDTVDMQGKPFNVLVKQGDTVQEGQELVDMDIDQIKKAGKKPTVIVVITNSKDKIKDLAIDDNKKNDSGNQAVGKISQA